MAHSLPARDNRGVRPGLIEIGIGKFSHYLTPRPLISHVDFHCVSRLQIALFQNALFFVSQVRLFCNVLVFHRINSDQGQKFTEVIKQTY